MKTICKLGMAAYLACTIAIMGPVSWSTAAVQAAEQGDVVMDSMEKELDRSFTKLKNAEDAPLYYLAYRVCDTQTFDLLGDYGSLMTGNPDTHDRVLQVDVRVGNRHIDNTHRIRGVDAGLNAGMQTARMQLPIDADGTAIRAALWDRTDAAFKAAEDRYSKVSTEAAIRVAEEDPSDDFSKEKPVIYNGPPVKLEINKAEWEERIRKLSAIYKKYEHIKDSTIRFTAVKIRRYLVNSEGTRVQDEQLQLRISTTADAIADDGMRVWLYDGAEGSSLADMPDQQKLEQMVKKVADDVTALRVAKVAEPFAGPAILHSKAAGVFFHEIFGHRIEGHRQKDEGEGRTFTKLIGQPIMPPFISVIDDPTKERLGSRTLNGYYKFDDEGVPAQKVVLVDKGVLKNFLMSRSPIHGFETSNGHGRSAPSSTPVARQGNLIVQSSERTSFEKLRAQLITEIKRQNKSYGLLFDEIAGGFTMTQTFMPQVFKLKPLRVWRIYADGKPDELLRGVDLVGTPLTSLEKIICAADDDDIFNGTCGAESGPVPVSAVSPSLLVGTIEVERQTKEQDKPPLLPPPDHDKGKSVEKAKGE